MRKKIEKYLLLLIGVLLLSPLIASAEVTLLGQSDFDNAPECEEYNPPGLANICYVDYSGDGYRHYVLNDGEYKLTEDIYFDDDDIILDEKNIVLDLNGMSIVTESTDLINAYTTDLTITGNGTLSAISYVLEMSFESNVTIENGTFKGRIVSSSGELRSANNSINTIIINGGLFEPDEFEVLSLSNADVTINGGTFKTMSGETIRVYENTSLTINNGIFNSYYTALYASYNEDRASEEQSITINGGQFYGESMCGFEPHSYPNVTINGGIFIGGEAGLCIDDISGLKLSGGLFKSNGYGGISIFPSDGQSDFESILSSGYEYYSELNIYSYEITTETINENTTEVGYATRGAVSVVESAEIGETEYTITFNDNSKKKTLDNPLLDRQIATKGENVVLKANSFVNIGYTFAGWNTDKDGNGTSYSDLETVSFNDDITLYAQWEPYHFEIHYDANGGEGSVESQSFTAGDEVILRENAFTAPTGYKFDGWTYFSSGSDVVMGENDEVNIVPTEDNEIITLYAQWEPISYTIVYNNNGGAGTVTSQEARYDFSIRTYYDDVFAKYGYTFVEWNTEADGSGVSYQANKLVSNLTTVDGATITLYAQWEPIHYWISYYTYDGNTTQFLHSDYVAYDTATNILTNTYERNGYTFAGWNTESDGSGNSYDEGQEVINLKSVADSSLILFAQWTPVTFTVNYYPNGGEGEMISNQVTFGTTKTINNSFTKEGYHFGGWSINSYEPLSLIQEDELITMVPGNNDLDYYAYWVPNDYTIEYNANGGTGEVASQDASYGETIGLRNNSFTKSDYVFTGWNTEADGSGTSYTAGQEVSNLTSVDGSTVTLYAQWRGCSMTIVYDANGGSGTVEPQNYNNGDNIVTRENGFTAPTGYKFDSWNMSADGSDAPIGANDTFHITVSDDNTEVTLYAIWTPISYTVSYFANGGEGEMESQSVRYDEEVTIKENEFTNDGYFFTGWNTDPEGTGTSYTENQVVSNVTTADNSVERLYAQWEEINPSIARDVSGIDFGTANIGFQNNRTEAVIVTNDGNVPVTLDLIIPTGDGPFGCIAFDKDAILNPGENMTITLIANPSSAFATIAGTYNGIFQIIAKDAYTHEEVDRQPVQAQVVLIDPAATQGTITFNANNGTDELATQNITYNEDVALEANSFTNDGYTFVEWNTEANGSGTSYEDEQVVNFSEDKVLYAIWQEDNATGYEINNLEVDTTNSYIMGIDINTELEDYLENFVLDPGYDVEVQTKTVDGKEVLYTGGKTTITYNGEVYKEFTNVVSGDASGDGEITYMDYVKVYNHIQKVKHPELNKNLLTGAYREAADMDGSDEIGYMDYVKIYNKIKQLKGQGN